MLRFCVFALTIVTLVGSVPNSTRASIRGPIAPERASINSVLGDVSFVEAFGRLPNAHDDVDLRLRTHLEYVEGVLRARDVSHLSASQRRARGYILDVLHEYQEAGAFPRNRDLSGYRPCFVDLVTDNVCAVGYLIERTRGRDVVDAINADYQYASVFQIDEPVLATWLDDFGLTRVEAAMIQPFYPDEFVEVTLASPGHVVVVPDGSGPALGPEGHTVTVTLLDANGDPIAGFPRQDLYLQALDDGGTMAACFRGTIADANTDANGVTTFTGSMAAGGWTDDGLHLVVSGNVVYESPLPVTVNSPDINGDLQVNLADVGLFALDFVTGYAFRSDLAGDLDGVLNIADVGRIASWVGRGCP